MVLSLQSQQSTCSIDTIATYHVRILLHWTWTVTRLYCKRWPDYIVKEDLLGSQDDPEEYGSNVLIPNWSEWTRLVFPDALVISRLELYNINNTCSSPHYAVLAAGHIWLLGPAAPNHERGGDPLLPHTEAQLEPYQHLPCEHTHLWDNMSSACMLHNLCLFNVS